MSGWLDSLFGNLPSPPARPASRNTFGAAYRNAPTSPNVDDRRGQGPDYRVDLNRSRGALSEDYQPTRIPGGSAFGGSGVGYDPMATIGGRGTPNAPYGPSYPQNMPPGQGYSEFDRPASYGFNTSNDVPYIGPHLPISPGDPGWTPPPSPSGPHNPGGDPNRPGYGAAIGMPDAAAQPSYQQMIDFLQSWRGAQ